MSLDTDRIEADLNESRERLNDTLEQLGSKLSPGQLLDEALGMARGQMGKVMSNLGRQVRENPMPALMIVGGIAWFIASSRQSRGQNAWQDSQSGDEWRSEWSETQYRSVADIGASQRLDGETDEAYNDRLHQGYAGALGLKQKAGEALSDFRHRVANVVSAMGRRASRTASGTKRRLNAAVSGASNLGQSATSFTQNSARRLGERAGRAREATVHFYDDSPLAAGAIALAIGAIIGSAAPLTRRERQTLRGVADRVTTAGADLAERGARLVEERMSGAGAQQQSQGEAALH